MNVSDFEPVQSGFGEGGSFWLLAAAGTGAAAVIFALFQPNWQTDRFIRRCMAAGGIMFAVGSLGAYLGYLADTGKPPSPDTAQVQEWAASEYGLGLDSSKADEIRSMIAAGSPEQSVLIERDGTTITVTARADEEGDLHLMVAESELEPLEGR